MSYNYILEYVYIIIVAFGSYLYWHYSILDNLYFQSQYYCSNFGPDMSVIRKDTKTQKTQNKVPVGFLQIWGHNELFVSDRSYLRHSLFYTQLSLRIQFPIWSFPPSAPTVCFIHSVKISGEGDWEKDKERGCGVGEKGFFHLWPPTSCSLISPVIKCVISHEALHFLVCC